MCEFAQHDNAGLRVTGASGLEHICGPRHGALVSANTFQPDAGPSEGKPTVYTNLFHGSGELRVWSLLRAPAEPFSAVLTCELAPAGSVGPHVQQEFPELVLGIAGEGEARVDGVPQRLGPSTAVYLPLGATLEIVNRSTSEALRYLIVKARAQPVAEGAR